MVNTSFRFLMDSEPPFNPVEWLAPKFQKHQIQRIPSPCSRNTAPADFSACEIHAFAFAAEFGFSEQSAASRCIATRNPLRDLPGSRPANRTDPLPLRSRACQRRLDNILGGTSQAEQCQRRMLRPKCARPGRLQSSALLHWAATTRPGIYLALAS